MAQTTDNGMALVRRLNQLMAEREEAIRAAGGWLTGTDPSWREDWKARKDALLADVRAHDAAMVAAR